MPQQSGLYTKATRKLFIINAKVQMHVIDQGYRVFRKCGNSDLEHIASPVLAQTILFYFRIYLGIRAVRNEVNFGQNKSIIFPRITCLDILCSLKISIIRWRILWRANMRPIHVNVRIVISFVFRAVREK